MNMAETKEDKLGITLHVYDEEFRVTVDRSQEAYYRAAAKLITDKYNTYADLYKGRKSDHSIALMTLIDIAVRYEKEASKNDTSPLMDILNSLSAEIEDALGESKN